MYNKRTWLNSETSSSTGSVVAFDGMVKWKGEDIRSTFLAIYDCNNSARLHMADGDTPEDFIDKMVLLRDEIDSFIKHLKNEMVKTGITYTGDNFREVFDFLKRKDGDTDADIDVLYNDFMENIKDIEHPLEKLLVCTIDGNKVLPIGGTIIKTEKGFNLI